MKDDDLKIDCLYNEKPKHGEIHPVNYLKIIGDTIKQYRLSLKDESNSQESFGRMLEKYNGMSNRRHTIKRLEDGSPNSYWGLVFAVMYEKGIIPEVCSLMQSSDKQSLNYILMIENQLTNVEAIQLMHEKSQNNLRKRLQQEKKL